MLRAALAAILLLLLLVSPARSSTNIDAGTNTYRVGQGLVALPTSTTLTNLALQRAEQIVSDFSHTYWWWDASGCAGIGENLAWTTADDLEWPLSAWIASPSHQANLVGDWDVQGSAEIIVDGSRYAVQLFGKDCGGGEGQVAVPTNTGPTPMTPRPSVPPPVYLPDTAMCEQKMCSQEEMQELGAVLLIGWLILAGWLILVNVKEAEKKAVKKAPSRGYYCRKHGVPESECSDRHE